MSTTRIAVAKTVISMSSDWIPKIIFEYLRLFILRNEHAKILLSFKIKYF